MPLQDGHSFQSESLIALEFVPVQRSPLMVLPQRRLMRVGLYPALPHSVQDVTGTGRFVDMNAPWGTIARTQVRYPPASSFENRSHRFNRRQRDTSTRPA